MNIALYVIVALLVLSAIAYFYPQVFDSCFIKEKVVCEHGLLCDRFKAEVSTDREEYYVKGEYNNHFTEVCSKELYVYLGKVGECSASYRIIRRSFLKHVISDKIISVRVSEELEVDVTQPHIVIEDLI